MANDKEGKERIGSDLVAAAMDREARPGIDYRSDTKGSEIDLDETLCPVKS